jgi:hypothetical protein
MAPIKQASSSGLRIKPIQPAKYYLEARINSGDRIAFRLPPRGGDGLLPAAGERLLGVGEACFPRLELGEEHQVVGPRQLANRWLADCEIGPERGARHLVGWQARLRTVSMAQEWHRW